ncbi:MAG: hypothetical protein IJT50_00465 [Lentisphaeria bacterium]|nr:hypothetical protein [Lentisphaeria bacterium]
MKSWLRNFIIAALLVVCASQMSAAEYGTFESFYTSGGLGFWDWTFIVVGTIGVGVLTFVTFGGGAAAAPAWIATVGTWIGSTVGLSGVAAANFGLALLGGGAIAAGGLGVAGGVAVLSAMMTFGVDMALTYGTDLALEKWSQDKFVEANKTMMVLPVPRNKKGGKAYKATITYLTEKIKQDKAISDPENQEVLESARRMLLEEMWREEDKDYILKNKTLLSLILLQVNEYASAAEVAKEAMEVADEIKKEKTLPAFIWALSELAQPEKECGWEVISSLMTAYKGELKNKLMPIMTGSCMDRLMYRYHYGKLSSETLAGFCDLITDNKIRQDEAAISLEIFISRCLIELKRTHQDIYIITKDRSLMKDKKVVAELKKRLERHKALISILQIKTLPPLHRLISKFPEKSEITIEKMTSLLGEYWGSIAELESKIRLAAER